MEGFKILYACDGRTRHGASMGGRMGGLDMDGMAWLYYRQIDRSPSHGSNEWIDGENE